MKLVLKPFFYLHVVVVIGRGTHPRLAQQGFASPKANWALSES
jgi:hypothetical protein